MISSTEANGLRFDMFTGAERFIAPNAVLVSGRNDSVLIDCGFVKSDVEKLLNLVKGWRLRPALQTFPIRGDRKLRPQTISTSGG
jgi:hypothetical protein